jgi:hypothetical protein
MRRAARSDGTEPKLNGTGTEVRATGTVRNAAARVTRAPASDKVGRRPRTAITPSIRTATTSGSESSGTGTLGGSTATLATVGIGSSSSAFSHCTVAAPGASMTDPDDSGSITVAGTDGTAAENSLQLSVTVSGMPGTR